MTVIGPMKQEDLTVWISGPRRGIPGIIICRILMLLWPFRPPYSMTEEHLLDARDSGFWARAFSGNLSWSRVPLSNYGFRAWLPPLKRGKVSVEGVWGSLGVDTRQVYSREHGM